VSGELRLLDALRLEDGSRWGDVATDVQRADALAILDRSLKARFHWLGRARGYSKTVDLAGIALEVLLAQAPAGSRSYAFGADRDQAALLVDALAGFVRRGGAPLADLIEVQAWKIAVRKTGATLEAKAADEAGSWGLRPFLLVCDELPMWPTSRGARRLWESVSSAVPKTSGRLVVAGTAGDPAHWSAKVREHALADNLWRVSEVHGPPPWMDDRLIEEQRRRLPESSFQRLFENRWVSGEDRLVAAEDLAACVVLDGPQEPISGMRYVIGVDVGLKRDATVAAVCHLEHGVVTLDRLGVWRGSRRRPVKLSEVEEWLVEASRRYWGSVVCDPWQAVGLIQRLRSRGVSVSEYAFSAQSVGRLASSLFLLLRDRMIRLPDDPELLDELANVRLRESSPGVLRMDHDTGRHDDRAIALALASHRLVARGEGSAPMGAYVASGRLPERSLARRDEIPDVERRALARMYGAALGGEMTRFARRRLARIPGAGRASALDRQLGELGIDRWSVDRGKADLQAIIDRSGPGGR
jgi:phage terminase large subunit-like protein